MTTLAALPDPYRISWQDWVDTLIGFNPELYATIDPAEPWRLLAQRLCERVADAPQPDLFTSWQDWAAALKVALQA